MEPIAHNILPPRLQLHHNLGLEASGLDVTAPVLMPCLFSGLTDHIVVLGRPRMSPPSASFEAKGSVAGSARGPQKSGAPGPFHEVGLNLPIPASMEDVLKYEPYSSHESTRLPHNRCPSRGHS